MNVRIFWVCAIECMCAQTRPRFILSSERILGEWSQNLCQLQGRNPLYWENFSSEGDEPMTLHQAGQWAQYTTNKLFRPPSSRTVSPIHYQQAIPAPIKHNSEPNTLPTSYSGPHQAQQWAQYTTNKLFRPLAGSNPWISCIWDRRLTTWRPLTRPLCQAQSIRKNLPHSHLYPVHHKLNMRSAMCGTAITLFWVQLKVVSSMFKTYCGKNLM